MSKVNTNDSFIHLWYIWRIVGLYPFAKLKWLYTIYAVLTNFVADIVSPVSMCLNVFLLRDLASIMKNLEVSPTLIAASLKQIVLFFRMPKFHEVKIYLNQLDHRANCNTEDVKYLTNAIKQCHRMLQIVEIALIGSLASYTIPSLNKRTLLFESWFPFDWASSNTLYLFAFLFQFLSTGFQCIQNAASDAYPPIYINVLMAHIHVLCMRVARIGKDPSKTPDENYKELKSCVNDHRNVIRLFETISPAVSETILIQFTITALVLCTAVVHLLIFDRKISQLITTLAYVFCILAESFPVCYFGNGLMTETDNLTTAIYDCNWIDQPLKFRKNLIIFMQRSQKTNKILAGGVAVISLQTFIGILRFSFSMFAVLSQLQH